MKDSRIILGVYIEPHVWVVKSKDEIERSYFETISKEKCVEVIFSKKFGNDIEVCVQRQGFIVVAFPEKIIGLNESEIKTSNLLPIKVGNYAIEFFNSFLYLLYDQTFKSFNGGYQCMRQSIQISDLWRWRNNSFFELKKIAITQPMKIMNQSKWINMDTEIFDTEKSLGVLSKVDRSMRPEQILNSIELTFDLLCSEKFIAKIELLSLLNKSLVLIQNCEFDSAHILCWTVAENLLGIEWSDYLNKTNSNVDQNGKKSINSKRKDALTNSAYTASIRAEILELAKELPFSIYEALCSSRKVRNDWMHSLEKIDQNSCRICYNMARDLLSRNLKYDIQHPCSQYIQDEFFKNISK